MVTSRKKFRLFGTVIVEKMEILPPFRYEADFQHEGCFLYISGQKTIFRAPDENVEVNSGNPILLKCGHYFADWLESSSSEKVLVYAIHLREELLLNLYKDDIPSFKQTSIKKQVQKIVPDITIQKYMEGLDFYFEHPDIVSEELLVLKIKELILLLIQSKHFISVSELFRSLFSENEIIIKNVINTHLYTNFSVAELSRLCNMSISTFKREFHKTFNDTPNNYINSKRLIRAKELLEHTNASITEIAFDLGYNDPAYFSRLFKKKYQLSPSSVRK